MVKRDYYEILGINKSASKDEIKKVYRKLSKKYRPNINKEEGVDEKFKKISKAYEVLSDENERADYDQFGYDGPQDGFGSQGFGGSNFGRFEDIFNSFLGGGSRQRDPNAPRKGDDFQYIMTITSEEAVSGTKKGISIKKDVTCHTCNGDGAKSGIGKKTCSYCSGASRVSAEQNTVLGRVRIEQVCPRCEGSGQEFEEPCLTCKGEGTESRTVKLEVTVPEGVDNEQQVRLAREGSLGVNEGSHGDLYAVLRVKPSNIFERSGDDIYYSLDTNFSQAVLGGEIKIPTLKSNVVLTTPAGTQTGKQLRLKDKGAKNVHGYGYGDLFANIKAVTPTRLNDRQKESLKEFAETNGENISE